MKILYLNSLLLILISQNSYSIDWYIEHKAVIVFAKPIMITDSCRSVTYVKFKRLFNIKGESNDTFLVRFEYQSSASPLCYVDDIKKDYLLFLDSNYNDYYDFTITSLLFKIEKYDRNDFDSAYISINNLDSIFTYGFNQYRTVNENFLKDSLKLDSEQVKITQRQCHYVEGFDAYPCNQYARPKVFPDSLLLTVFNTALYRKTTLTFQMIPWPWLIQYIDFKLTKRD